MTDSTSAKNALANSPVEGKGSVGGARIAILGAGDRGTIYARFLKAAGARIVAGVDWDRSRAAHLAESVAPEAILYSSWQDYLTEAQSKNQAVSVPDAVVIALPDAEHLQPAIEFSGRGISVLLEKPVGLKLSELDRMERHVRAIRKKGSRAAIVVCHVLRYSQFFGAIKTAIQQGLIGEIRSILHCENVSYYHFAHSYVRGNWKDSRTSSPVLLAKCSHDFDLIGWFADSEFVSVQSSGSQSTFLPERAPAGATERCIDGCPHQKSCLYDAESTYIDALPIKRELIRSGRPPLSWMAALAYRWPRLLRRFPFAGRLRPWPFWPTSTIVSGPVTAESLDRALRTGPYGRCVYFAGSNQPDHADTVIQFRNGITATMRLNGNSFQEARTLRIDGSLGSLEGRFGQGGDLRLHRHGRARAERIPVQVDAAGHLREDRALCLHFLEVLECIAGAGTRVPEAMLVRTLEATDLTLHQVIQGHRMALLAEKSRTTGKTIFR